MARQWSLALLSIFFFVGTTTTSTRSSSSLCGFSEEDCAALAALELDGHISFTNLRNAAKDFGQMHYNLPGAILYPSSVNDIAAVVKTVFASKSNLTIAAKGAGHSIAGQAQVRGGIVIEMGSLRGIQVFSNNRDAPYSPYVQASGGELWIEVVKECLKSGLTPRSLTDYLYLSVGGTLSNAGVSGQAFRYGPQISNVLHLEVVTGKGAIVNCSPQENADLFFSVLGGLGQFGIITKATIHLKRAPQKVKWIRTLYSDFATFTRDQEDLIKKNWFDYVEGSVVVNNKHPSNEYKPISFHGQMLNASSIPDSAGPVLYCLELTKDYNEEEEMNIDEKVSSMMAELGHIPWLVFSKDASYFEFLNRVHEGEIRLRKKGLWDVPHPWMNLLVPKSKIEEFDKKIFKRVLRKGINGPLLVYALNRVNWDSRTSAVIPSEDIFYLVGMLRYTSISGIPSASSLVDQNKEILSLCKIHALDVKQYLPQYSKEDEWSDHFGISWGLFLERKATFDPRAILAPGQKILPRQSSPQSCSNHLCNH